ncbi:MAG: hypothetical protein DME97_11510 [Verrucomicrobia bacterium]|nr:MAG: hypothetical protein DME97_11510 [Verrucomicrobiota bacterium]
MKPKTRVIEPDELTPRQLRSRLDAIVLLLAALKYSEGNADFDRGRVAKLLHRAGYTPTEIAHLFGKQKATDVSKYLY